MNAEFFSDISTIDSIVARGASSGENIAELIELIRKPQNSKYFYDTASSPDWLVPLQMSAEFTTHRLEEDAISRTGRSNSDMPALRYLSRITESNPTQVAHIVAGMEVRNNPVICREVFAIALHFTNKLLKQYSTTLCDWLKKSKQYSDPSTISTIVRRLWEEDSKCEALQLLSVALEPLPASDSFRNVHCRMDDWSIKEFLRIVVPKMASCQDMRALTCFASLVNSAHQLVMSDKTRVSVLLGAGPPAVEDHEQNQLYENYPNLLIFAVRDIAFSLMPSAREEVVTLLRSFDAEIFVRIELYLHSVGPELDVKRASELLGREDILSESEYHHERFLLLNAYFDRMPAETKAYYFRFVEDETRLARIREKRRDIRGEEWPNFKKRLIYDRLIPIAKYLEGEWKARYDEYVAEFGEEPHPDFLFYMEGGQLINHMPSRPLEEFSDCSAEAFSNRIRALEAALGASIKSKSELANTLRDLVSVRTAEFAAEAFQFSGLPIMYTRSFLGSIRDYLETQRPLDPHAWQSVLKLCDAEVQLYRSVVEGRGSYRETYIHLRTIISVVRSGFKQEETKLPVEERDLAWKTLHPLTDHPDPQADEEDANEDMATSSINTVRGEAMHAVVDYAWWVKRKMENEFRGMASIPEAAEVLKKHLAEDKALTICAVYGKWYPWLEALDSGWAKGWKPRIFPEADTNRRRVAWETYITFCPPYNGIFETLKDDYAWAITQIGEWPERQRPMGHPDDSLLEHLFAYYWRDRLPLDDPQVSLRDAYEKSSEEHKVEALRFVGRNVKEWVDADTKTLDRLKKLWTEIVKPAGGQKPLETFGLWFSSRKFEAEWSLSELQYVLDQTLSSLPEHWVIQRLGELAPEYPKQTLNCLWSIYHHDHQEIPFYMEHWWEHVIAVLRSALLCDDSGTRARAIELANIIGAKGLQPQHLDELRGLVRTVPG